VSSRHDNKAQVRKASLGRKVASIGGLARVGRLAIVHTRTGQAIPNSRGNVALLLSLIPWGTAGFGRPWGAQYSLPDLVIREQGLD
jgi:hypothetical protein